MQDSSVKNNNGGLIKFILLGFLAVCVASVCIFVIVNNVNKKKEVEKKREIQRHIEESIPGGMVENLQWSSRSLKKMSWDSAVSYCENLAEDGHDDWRMPNIDELRTTVKNCLQTEVGGSCRVSEKGGCLSLEQCVDKQKGSCFCEYKENNGGYYSKLGDSDGVWLWSSSVVSDKPNSRWRIGFSSGMVIHNDTIVNFYVRCVR